GVLVSEHHIASRGRIQVHREKQPNSARLFFSAYLYPTTARHVVFGCQVILGRSACWSMENVRPSSRSEALPTRPCSPSISAVHCCVVFHRTLTVLNKRDRDSKPFNKSVRFLSFCHVWSRLQVRLVRS